MPVTFFKVSVVVDVRDIPLSRKRGFSKNQLREALAEVGIKYPSTLSANGSPSNAEIWRLWLFCRTTCSKSRGDFHNCS